MIITIFTTHWLACGYRLAADHIEGEFPGWVEAYLEAHNIKSATVYEQYIAALYYSASVITVVGPSQPWMAPTNDREFIFSILATYVAYFLLLFSITNLSHIFMLTKEVKRKQDVLVDEYLNLFTSLKLDKRLKLTVIFFHLGVRTFDGSL